MKIRPLPEIDLARIAPMQNEQRLRALALMKIKFPPHSYAPMRHAVLDILNVEAGPLAPGHRTSWDKIEREIRRRARHEEEIEVNLSVAEALYKFANECQSFGRRQQFFPLPIGLSTKVVYWYPAVVSLAGKATVFFIDPRKSNTLTSQGRRFVFSMMHERIRAAEPDFANLGLGIIQFSVLRDKSRRAAFHSADGVELFSFAQLDTMVRETYALWEDVLSERDAETRRRAYGESGSLL